MMEVLRLLMTLSILPLPQGVLEAMIALKTVQGMKQDTNGLRNTGLKIRMIVMEIRSHLSRAVAPMQKNSRLLNRRMNPTMNPSN